MITKGKWEVGEIHGKRTRELWIHEKGRTCPVAYVNVTNMEKEKLPFANARLIAAAPEVTEEGENLLKITTQISNLQHAGVEIDDDLWSDLYQQNFKLATAIAKAKGGE